MNILKLFPIINKLIDKVVPDKSKAAELKAQMQVAASAMDSKEFDAQKAALLAEIGGDSAYQRNWRPTLMYLIMVIMANNFILAPYVGTLFDVDLMLKVDPNAIPERMWVLLTVAIGGYIPGRSLEKIYKTYKETANKDG